MEDKGDRLAGNASRSQMCKHGDTMGDLVRQIRGEFEKPVRRRLNVFYRVRTSSIRIDRYWEYRKRDKSRGINLYICNFIYDIQISN